MKRFEDLDIDDQNLLLIWLLHTVVATSSKTIGEVAQKRGNAADELWRDICAQAGLDACHPWQGYPFSPVRAARKGISLVSSNKLEWQD
jgi:hypothetical protein